MADRVTERAHAKTNLRLRVLGRDESGFHGLETLFLRLELADEVTLTAGGDGIRLSVEAGDAGEGEAGAAGDVDPTARIPEGPENLCWVAARRFFEAAGREPAVSIRLRKRIPAGAGLGGGSADAAAVLRGLGRLLDEPLSRDEVTALAGELGSDVPFALAGEAAALGWERGRRILPLPAPEPRPLLVVVPGLRVSTPDAYRWIDDARERPDGGGRASGGPGGAAVLPPCGTWGRWDVLVGLQVNDFEGPVFRRHPELAWWREELLGEGAEIAFLSGSGSALSAVFADERTRDAAAERVRESGEVAVIPTRAPV